MSEVLEAMVTEESSPVVDQTPEAVPKAGHGAIAGDLPNIHLSFRLDGRNYLQWAQLVKTFLKVRWKISHLTAFPPNSTDPIFPT